MKKFIYILLIAFSSSVVITSCTEEEVAPAPHTESSGGSGGTQSPGPL
jgi:hypothetical protein